MPKMNEKNKSNKRHKQVQNFSIKSNCFNVSEQKQNQERTSNHSFISSDWFKQLARGWTKHSLFVAKYIEVNLESVEKKTLCQLRTNRL